MRRSTTSSGVYALDEKKGSKETQPYPLDRVRQENLNSLYLRNRNRGSWLHGKGRDHSLAVRVLCILRYLTLKPCSLREDENSPHRRCFHICETILDIASNYVERESVAAKESWAGILPATISFTHIHIAYGSLLIIWILNVRGAPPRPE